ncbi:lasso peptide biosynthesis B2 protein [Bacillus alkalicellulosilyticus]|uniref:lasso peptide biosynthesis B2 protein n=1 Tax=Alkalihalobacterium alkalicellulosilyticum TaxID=1912214 RepID=UPI0009969314|nr:lasso peptide biosynthesis B2 protein [Bacillus alkalicellulosilyticus]
MGKMKAFFSMNHKERWLLAEAYFYLAWGRVMKLLPFTRVAPRLGKHMVETPFDVNVEKKKTLASVSQAIHIMSKYTFWESQCLVKGFAAMKMLEKRKIESTLYLGTARDEKGEMIAHAWVRSGPYYITGSEGMERFTVVGKFAKTIEG